MEGGVVENGGTELRIMSVDNEIEMSAGGGVEYEKVDEGTNSPVVEDHEEGVIESDFTREATLIESLDSTWLRLKHVSLELWKLWAFLYANSVVGYMYNAVDLVFLGRLGETALGAGGLANAWMWFVSWFAIGVGQNGVYTLCSQAHGRGDSSEIARTMHVALASGLIAFVPVFVCLFFAAQILGLAGIDEQLQPYVGLMARIAIPGIAAETMTKSLEAVLLSQRITSVPNILNVGSLVVNVALHWALVAQFGFVGSPLASALTRVLRLLAMVAALHFWKRPAWWTRPQRSFYAWPMFRSYLALTLPPSIAVVLEIGGFESSSFLAGSFGALFVSAHTCAFQYLVFAFFFGYSMSSATGIAVGNMLGARKEAVAKLYARVGFALVFICASFNLLWMGVGRSILPRVFTSNEDTIALAASILFPFTAVLTLPDGINSFCSNLLRALGKTLGSTLANIGGLVGVGIPLMFVLSRPSVLGIYGLWVGMICGASVSFLLQLIALYFVDWKKQMDLKL